MKKAKLLGVFTVCSAATAAGLSQIKLPNNSVSNTTTNKTNSMSVNSNARLTVQEEIQNIINNNVTQRTYLGSLIKATNGGDLSSIDLTKLNEITSTSQLVPAYLKISGEYTPSIEEAKRSHLKDPTIKYLDTKGVKFDSEIEAINAMKNNHDGYSNGIAYYEIEDYWTNSSSPKTYNINPLNAADITILKEIALKNATLSNNEFAIQRLVANNTQNYEINTEKGMWNSEIGNEVSKYMWNIVNNLVDNMYMDIEVRNASESTSRVKFGIDENFVNTYGKVNGFVEISFDQSQFDYLWSSASISNEVVRRADSVYNYSKDQIFKMFKGKKTPAIEALAERVATTTKKLAKTNVMGKLWDKKISSGRQATLEAAKRAVRENLYKYMEEKINEEFRKDPTISQTNLYWMLTNEMKNAFQINGKVAATTEIHAITYNGMPLFKIDPVVYQSIVDTEEFKVDSSNAIKNLISTNLRNTPNYANTTIANLINISNTYQVKNGVMTFKTSSIANYNNNSKYSNFEFLNNTNNLFSNETRLINEELYNTNNIPQEYLVKQLVRREQDNKNALNNQYGTYEAIYQYNNGLQKALSLNELPDGLKQGVEKGIIKNTNDVVFLYDKNKNNETIKYGRYLTYGWKFNPSLTDGTSKIISSEETLHKEFELENVASPVKEYSFYDYNNNLVWQETISSVAGNYEQSINDAWTNALRKINVTSSSEYVYYKADQAALPQLKEYELNRLYVLTWDPNTSPIVRNSSAGSTRATQTIGFTTLGEVQDYLYNYYEIVTGETITQPGGSGGTPNYVLTKDYSTVINWAATGIVLIVIISALMALYFYYISTKPKNITNIKINK